MTARALGTAVLIEGETALRMAKYAAVAALEKLARAGMPPGPELVEIYEAAKQAQSQPGHSDGPEIALAEDCSPTDLIDSATAAHILGVTRRQVVRLGATLDGTQLPNGYWTFHRGTVEDYARQRPRQTRRRTAA
ncbi:hypothetical protein ACWFOS_13670 [Gordonia terrae]